jgi:hypothetical protein
MKSNIVLQMDVKDFEALANTYMAFNKSWNKQIKAGRFEGIKSNPGYTVIYWFDNALALIIAIHIYIYKIIKMKVNTEKILKKKII